MKFIKAPLEGAYVIELERLEDERGFFARSWCQREFSKYGLNPVIAQCNVSFNHKRGTIRGMHYQAPPFAEAKLVRCTRGSIYDVIIDLRTESTTFKQWFAVRTTCGDGKMLYIPEGFAHGFQTLEDKTEVFYQMSEFYHPKFSRGVRWNDPCFSVKWPEGEKMISKKDQQYPDFQP